jgi:hypothetical protein
MDIIAAPALDEGETQLCLRLERGRSMPEPLAGCDGCRQVLDRSIVIAAGRRRDPEEAMRRAEAHDSE